MTLIDALNKSFMNEYREQYIITIRMVIKDVMEKLRKQIEMCMEHIVEYTYTVTQREKYDCIVSSLTGIINIPTLSFDIENIFEMIESYERKEIQLLEKLRSEINIPDLTIYPEFYDHLDSVAKRSESRKLFRSIRDERLNLVILEEKQKLMIEKINRMLKNTDEKILVKVKEIALLKEKLQSEYDKKICYQRIFLSTLLKDIENLFVNCTSVRK